MEYELQHQWAIFEVDDRDFIAWSDLDIPKVTPLATDQFYNQSAQARTRNACVLYWMALCVTRLTGHRFTLEELLSLVDFAEEKYGWREDRGMLFSAGANCMRTWWNARYPNKLTSWRFRVDSREFEEAIEKGYSVAVWYNTTRGYLLDSQDNWNIDTIDPREYGKMGGGHLVSVIEKDTIADNYEGRKPRNVYTHKYIEDHLKAWYWFPSAYFFTLDVPMPKTNYEKFLERGFIEQPKKDRVLTEELFGTLMERILEAIEKDSTNIKR